MSQLEWLQLEDDEEIEWKGEPSLKHMVAMLPGTLIAALVFSALIWFVFASGYGAPMFIVVFITVSAFIAGVEYISIKNTDYVMTNKHVYAKKGNLSETVDSTGLENIQNTSYNQSALQGMYDVGTVKISTAGGGGTEISFKSIDEPRKVDNQLQQFTKEGGGVAKGGRQGVQRTSPEAGVDPENVEELSKEAKRLRREAEYLEEMFKKATDEVDGEQK